VRGPGQLVSGAQREAVRGHRGGGGHVSLRVGVGDSGSDGGSDPSIRYSRVYRSLSLSLSSSPLYYITPLSQDNARRAPHRGRGPAGDGPHPGRGAHPGGHHKPGTCLFD
jgi:hypothetical protein